MVDALVQALVAQGCPLPEARGLAARAGLRDHADGAVLVLEGQGTGAPDPDDGQDVGAAVTALAEDLAALNAEAVDRAARGERVRAPLWPLPGRVLRRTDT